MQCPSCNKEIVPGAFFCTWCETYVVDPNLGTKAGLFSRFIALLIDPFIGLSFFIFTFLFSGMIVSGMESSEGKIALMIAGGFNFIYFVFFLYLISLGYTPGKILLGLKVITKTTGRNPGFGKMFLREIIGRFLSSLFGGLGLLWALFDKNGQAWHDKLVGTVVIKEKNPFKARKKKEIAIAGVSLLALLILAGVVAGIAGASDSSDRVISSNYSSSNYGSTPQPTNYAPSVSGDIQSQISTMLNRWLASWNNKNFMAYRELYSTSFFGIKRTKRGKTTYYTYDSWMNDRLKMMNHANWLSVEVRNLRFRSATNDEVEIQFDQYYLSDTYSDWGPKIIKFRREGYDWKIIYEEMLYANPL